MEDLADMIYDLSPAESPFYSFVQYARLKLRTERGGSMRKQRRRKAKPLRFTQADKAPRQTFEWRSGPLHEWAT